MKNLTEMTFAFQDKNLGEVGFCESWGGEPWLFTKHPDGQWVSLRKCTPDDLVKVEGARGAYQQLATMECRARSRRHHGTLECLVADLLRDKGGDVHTWSVQDLLDWSEQQMTKGA